jgi:pyridoxal phosphate enzyme (YggS family)
MSFISDQLKTTRQKIAAAAKAAGRDPASVELIAICKGHDEEAVRTAIKAGQSLFGENRVQEAQNKFVKLRSLHEPLKLHLVGPLQTNKVEDAVQLFDVIETLDRPNLADALAKAIRKIGKQPKLYVEVNIGQEPQKAGIAPKDFDIFLKYCRESCGLTIDGLMCIPPQGQNPEPYFLDLKNLAERFGLKRLSMGLSSDFETAIRCGATEVRVGTGIFGERVVKS